VDGGSAVVPPDRKASAKKKRARAPTQPRTETEVSAARRRYHVYVIALDDDVLASRRFRAANSHCERPRACLYVGMTARTPEERFAQHSRGVKACGYVKRFGIGLCPRLYESLNPLTYEDACRTEVELALRLRRKGFAVWQK